jgi:hypothetical protein
VVLDELVLRFGASFIESFTPTVVVGRFPRRVVLRTLYELAVQKVGPQVGFDVEFAQIIGNGDPHSDFEQLDPVQREEAESLVELGELDD